MTASGIFAQLRAILRFFSAIVAIGTVLVAVPARAQRAALIIANSHYANAEQLPNPASDAQLVAEAARAAGFGVVILSDLTRSAFDRALKDFREQADGAEVAMVYYAGHGIETQGRNWLLPVDARLNESRDLRYEAVELDAVLETLALAQRRLVILDACRNNPFGIGWDFSNRSMQRGLAASEVEGAMVIYAAAAGQLATDGKGDNSPFASAVAGRLAEPGLLLQMLGPKITDDVVAATSGKQRPWTSSGMGGKEFYLIPANSGPPVARQKD